MQIRFVIEKTVNTFKNQGLKGVLLKTYRRVNSSLLRLFINDHENKKKWESLRNRYSGKRVFLIGNGPSLNKTPLYLLKDEYTMCFNRFNLFFDRINWTPSFYVTTDNLVLLDLLPELEKIVPKTNFSFFPDIHFRGVNFINKIKPFPNLLWLNQLFGEGFSQNLPKVYPGASVIYEGFQILNYLGFKEIIIIGVDMNFKIHTTAKNIDSNGIDIISQKDDDPNHFDPRYFGKNRKYHQPEISVINNILDNLNYLGKNINDFKLKIFNAGYGSNVNAFPKINFEDLFKYSEKEKEKIFESLLLKNTTYKSITDFEIHSIFIENQEEWNKELGNFFTQMETGLNIIKMAVFTHIPLGPFNKKYYFKKII